MNIYRFVARETVGKFFPSLNLISFSQTEEEILQRAKNKMVLDHLVIQSMNESVSSSQTPNKGKPNLEAKVL